MKFILACIFTLLVVVGCKSSNTEAPVYKYGAGVGGGSLGIHTVRSGETVWVISQRYSVGLRSLIDLNDISEPFRLKDGQRLNIPAPQTYTVRLDDTIYSVSRLFGTTTTDLVRINKLNAPYRLRAGQVIRLPDATTQYADEKNNTKLSPIVTAAIPPNSVEKQVLTTPTMKKPQQASLTSQPPQRMGRFLQPVNGPIISNYGPKSDGQHNDGINIAAKRGASVAAAENGVVVHVGNQMEGYGNMILIRHADRYVTAYAHLDKVLVKEGDVIKRGQSIGTVGSTGLVSRPQLHFEIRRGTEALNPQSII